MQESHRFSEVQKRRKCHETRYCYIPVVHFLSASWAQTQPAPQAQKVDFVIGSDSGEITEDATGLFRTLVGHCPGINKYKADIEQRVAYDANGFSEPRDRFRVRVVDKPSSIPADWMVAGHTCYFSVNKSKANAPKRACARLCTGTPLPDIDSGFHDFVKGEVVRTSSKLKYETAKALREEIAKAYDDIFSTLAKTDSKPGHVKLGEIEGLEARVEKFFHGTEYLWGCTAAARSLRILWNELNFIKRNDAADPSFQEKRLFPRADALTRTAVSYGENMSACRGKVDALGEPKD